MLSFTLSGEQATIDLSALPSRALRGFCHHLDKTMSGSLGLILRGVFGVADLTISGISIHATAPVITTSVAHGLSVGDIVFLFGTDSDPIIDGAWEVVTVPSGTTFTILSVTIEAGSVGNVWKDDKVVTIGGSGIMGANVWFPTGIGTSVGPFKYVTARHEIANGDTSVFYDVISQDTPL